jgi:hypothetical protein
MVALRHCAGLLIVVGGLVAASPSSAADACHTEEQAVAMNGVVEIHIVKVCDPVVDPGTQVASDLPPTHLGLDAICVSTAMSNGVDPFEYCDIPPDEVPDLVTPGLVAAALRTVPLPSSVLNVEPPNGRTLVNFDTNFFTTTQPFDTAVTLLGQRVDLHITPAQFTWQFGDGESSSTTEPGAPYPALDVTHAYLHKGHVAPSVDTTYTAQFRVNGGPWRDVPGTVTIAGAPVDLQVLTATPVLVGYN